MIDDYVDRKFIKDIDADDICHLKKFARKLQHFYQGGKQLTALCASIVTYSKGSRWKAGCKISIICLDKRPGSRRAENEEQCHARSNKTDFLDHLANRENCIYHNLVLEFEALESCVNKAYGDRTILHFKQSNISYAHIHAPLHLQRN